MAGNFRRELPPFLRKPALGKPLSYNVPVTNRTATAIPNGSLVVLDCTNSILYSRMCVKLADALSAVGVQGVAVGIIAASGGKGVICIFGPAKTLVSDDAGDVAVGDQLGSSDHGSGGFAGLAGATPYAGTVLGYALQAQTGDSTAGTASTLKSVFVDPR